MGWDGIPPYIYNHYHTLPHREENLRKLDKINQSIKQASKQASKQENNVPCIFDFHFLPINPSKGHSI